MSAAATLEATRELAATPHLLGIWLTGLSPAALDADEGPGTWSPRAIVAHLIHGERSDWIPRVRRILEHGEGLAFEPFDRAGHAALADLDIVDLCDEFTRERQSSLDALAALRLTPGDLARRGRHPEFGAVTLEQLLATWVAHDHAHVAQIARVLARRQADAVGPWRAYLSLLRDWRR
jgi:uncharacterized damage-inducible protein DinB